MLNENEITKKEEQIRVFLRKRLTKEDMELFEKLFLELWSLHHEELCDCLPCDD